MARLTKRVVEAQTGRAGALHLGRRAERVRHPGLSIGREDVPAPMEARQAHTAAGTRCSWADYLRASPRQGDGPARPHRRGRRSGRGARHSQARPDAGRIPRSPPRRRRRTSEADHQGGLQICVRAPCQATARRPKARLPTPSGHHKTTRGHRERQVRSCLGGQSQAARPDRRARRARNRGARAPIPRSRPVLGRQARPP